MKKKVKIAATSDWHGIFPPMSFFGEGGDILCIVGDLCPVTNHSIEFQYNWINNTFLPKLIEIQNLFPKIVFIAGNHDFVFEQYGPGTIFYKSLPKNIIYLENNSVIVDGIKIWGSPYSNKFYNWAFMRNENGLKEIYDSIPSDVDIVLSHGPAIGVCDSVENDSEKLGSAALRTTILKIQPKYLFTGHIHSACRNIKYLNNTKCTCVSYVDEYYEPAYELFQTIM